MIHSKEFFEILHNERGQEVHGNYINNFSEENLILDKWAILDLKMVRPDNSESILRMFLKFCLVKGSKRHMDLHNCFCKKDLIEVKLVIVVSEMLHLQNCGSALKDLFIILHSERGEEAYEN